MYIIVLTYKKEIEQVRDLLDEHLQWLKKQYDKGIFIASGRQEPYVGGVILAKSIDRPLLESLLSTDPFNAVAEYKIIGFVPTITSDEFSSLKEI